MTDEICIGKTLAERKYVVGVPYPVRVSLYGEAPEDVVVVGWWCAQRWIDGPILQWGLHW